MSTHTPTSLASAAAQAASASPAAPILELRQATKTYAGVPAIDSVDFALRQGEIHAIVGKTAPANPP